MVGQAMTGFLRRVVFARHGSRSRLKNQERKFAADKRR